MTVVRMELDVTEAQAAGLANVLLREYVTPGLRAGWTAARVTVLTDFEARREQALLAAARYFLPPDPGSQP